MEFTQLIKARTSRVNTGIWLSLNFANNYPNKRRIVLQKSSENGALQNFFLRDYDAVYEVWFIVSATLTENAVSVIRFAKQFS